MLLDVRYEAHLRLIITAEVFTNSMIITVFFPRLGRAGRKASLDATRSRSL